MDLLRQGFGDYKGLDCPIYLTENIASFEVLMFGGLEVLKFGIMEYWSTVILDDWIIENCNLGLKSTTIGSDFEAGLENGNGIMGD